MNNSEKPGESMEIDNEPNNHSYGSGNNNNNNNNSTNDDGVDYNAHPYTHEGAHEGDHGHTNFPISYHTYVYAFCAAINSCNLGYDIGVSTEAAKMVQDEWGLTRIQREVFVGSINFWAMFGALAAQYFTDRFGRRYTFVWAAVGFIIGVLIMALAQTYGMLLIGRLFVGLGLGFGLAIDPMYIAEVSPAQHRGELVTWSEIAINVGIVLGFITGLLFEGLPNGVQWRVMFGLGAVFPTFMIYLVFNVMPESPRWLVSKQRNSEAANILRTIYPPDFDVNLVIQDIQEALQREQEAEKSTGWGTIFAPTPSFRRMLLVGVGTAVAQQAVGIDAIQYYLLDVIESSGITSTSRQEVILIGLGCLKLIFIVIGSKLFDRKGRRPLFFVSLIGMAIALAVISIAFAVDSSLSTAATVVGLAVYLSFFSVGMGPGGWLVPSEVFAISIRSKAMSVATFLNRATSTLMSSTFLSTAHSMGWAGFFLLLTVVCVIVLSFLYTFLPETKGRSLEDMSLYFAEITGDDAVLQAEQRIVTNRTHQISNNNASLTPKNILQTEII